MFSLRIFFLFTIIEADKHTMSVGLNVFMMAFQLKASQYTLKIPTSFSVLFKRDIPMTVQYPLLYLLGCVWGEVYQQELTLGHTK